ncbi:2-succinyl-5-enolpyruvyl-6-hydroxy-3-cyclohexene-1-carboxylic-acid synthase [Myroides sp. LJL116]
MIYPEIKLAQSILQICKQKKIKHIILSPGSRNAPLTIGFASDPYFTCYSIADERCAGFFAMGIAQQTQFPTALVCTSGSAVLNYYPSIAEAYYSQIPLIVISADRPGDKLDIGDGQTIRQKDVFNNHILYNANLSQQASQENDILINNAINSAIAQKGPVHINAPFEEPLYQTTTELSVEPTFVDMVHIDPQIINYPLFGEKWQNAKKKLLVIGCNTPGVLSEQIIASLGQDPSVVVLCQTTSNLHHPNFISNIDRFLQHLTPEEIQEFSCDILVTFGGMLISKNIKKLLRELSPKQHWHVDLLRHYDTFGVLSDAVVDTPERFFSNLTHLYPTKAQSSYQEFALKINREKQKKQEQYLANIPWSDMKAFQGIMQALPNDIELQLSNSSVIRYGQIFPNSPQVVVFANRGTSGIDGSTSTAIGASVAQDKPVVLISGDVSFFYDSNALWNSYIPKNFKIIVLNNQGGGIFRFLPGHQNTPLFSTFFETTHQLNAEHLAKMYGFNYFSAKDSTQLKASLQDLFSHNEQPGILEITTPTLINDTVLKQYYQNM